MVRRFFAAAGVLALTLSIFVGSPAVAGATQSAASASPSVTEIVPASAPTGARLIVVGSSLDSTDLSITFAGAGPSRVVALPVSRSATLLEVVVPITAASGEVRIVSGGVQVAAFPFTVEPRLPYLRVTTLAASQRGYDLLKQLCGIAIDPSTGDAYVADTSHHAVKAVMPLGNVRTVAGSGKPGYADGPGAVAQFKEPAGIAYDATRRALYVADTANHAIRKIVDGQVSTFAGTATAGDRDGAGSMASFNRPSGLSLDTAGRLFVADAGNNKIRMVTPDGVVSTVAGTGVGGFANGGVANSLFNGPEGVAVADDSLIVADTKNHRIRRIRDGVVTSLAGAGQPGYLDGAAAIALFAAPEGVAVLENGSILIADTGNHLIRELSPAGNVTTFSGAGKPGYIDSVNLTLAQFAFPSSVTAAGAVWIGDTQNAAVRAIYPTLRATALYPRTADPAGGASVRIFGTGFLPGATEVRFGADLAPVTWVTSTELIATVPAGTAGQTVDVTVRTVSGTSVISSAITYTGVPPTVTSVEPARGPASGGTVVTLLGSGFSSDAQVYFGASPAASVRVDSATRVTAVAPQLPPGGGDISVRTNAGEAVLRNAFFALPQPIINAMTPSSGRAGTLVTILGSGFDQEAAGNEVRFAGVLAAVTSASEGSLTVVLPEVANTGLVSVKTAGGVVTSAFPFTVVRYTGLQVTPGVLQLSRGASQQLLATILSSDGSSADVTTQAAWSTSAAAVADVSGGLVTARESGSATITATFAGFTNSAAVSVVTTELPPPDPATVAPANDLSVPTSFASSVAFLYAGNNPVQRNVAPGAIDTARVTVLRGRVLTRDGSPVAGVRISSLNEASLGYTLTRADGAFDFVANGGGAVTLQYDKSGFIPVSRQVATQWLSFGSVPDVVMIPFDSSATAIVPGSTTMQVARGSAVSDADGARQATMLFPAGISATMRMPDGSERALDTLTVRATEYTVGSTGLQAMPAELPAQSAYTYCVELSADEAVAAGATEVRFNQPVILYVENFLGFGVGGRVPAGWYDRVKGEWIAAPGGRVLRVLGQNGGLAVLDVDGDGAPDTDNALAALGITTEERSRVAGLYAAGGTFWRVPIPHFTPWDCNWPYGPPPGAVTPSMSEPFSAVNCPYPDKRCGSIIDVQNQTLGESVAIAGTPFRLHYSSERVPGRTAAYTVKVPVSGATVPAALRRIEVVAEVAGRRIAVTLAATPNRTWTFTWDGLDVYGRRVQGEQIAKIGIGYVYGAVYQEPAEQSRSFAMLSGVATRVEGRQELVLWQRHEVPIGQWTSEALGLGGWSLSELHTYDPRRRILYRGDGEKQSADATGNVIVPLVSLRSDDVATAPDGTVYILAGARLRRVARDGTVVTLAGGGTVASLDGAPPAPFSFLLTGGAVAVGRDGAVFVGDFTMRRIFKVAPDGSLTTFAGGGTDYTTSGIPARSAAFGRTTGLAVGPDGSLYVADQGTNLLRRIAPDGTIATVAGGGPYDYIGDGGPAIAANLYQLSKVTVAPDGSIYLSQQYPGRVRRIGTDGLITTVAGNSNWGSLTSSGTSATKVAMSQPEGVAVSPDGRILFAHSGSPGLRVAEVSSSGTLTFVAGTGTSTGAPSGNFGPPLRAALASPTAIALAPDGSIIVAENTAQTRRIVRSFPGLSADEMAVLSSDGAEAYIFDGNLRHLRTVDTVLGATIFRFAYDANGLVARVTDIDGRVTLIERNASGVPVAIAGPAGHRTTLTMKAGMLGSVTNPAGESRSFEYGHGGLLTRFEDPKSQAHTYEWTADGLLAVDRNAAGGSQTLVTTRAIDGYAVSVTTAEGRTATYSVRELPTGDIEYLNTDAAGLVTKTARAMDASVTTVVPDGTRALSIFGPDPRFGMQSAYVTESTITTPAGRSLRMTSSRTATLANLTNPFSATSITSTFSIGTATWRRAFDVPTRTVTSTTPSGRASQIVLDAKGRVVEARSPGLAPISASYDTLGRFTGTQQGGRSSSLKYDARDRVTELTDALGRTVQFAYDDADRVTTQTLPDGRVIRFGYDANGNVTSVTPPGRPDHTFTYDAADQAASYTPPAGGAATEYVYDRDQQLTRIKRPGGTDVALAYDTAGRLSTLSSATASLTYQYAPSTGVLQAITAGSGASLAYSFDGPLPLGVTWSGPVSGAVSYTWDTRFRLASETAGGLEVSFGYDTDDLLTSAGALVLTRNPQSGFVTGSTVGSVTDAWTYNDLGDVMSYTASYTGTPLVAWTYTRDAAGRITSIAGDGPVRGYEYDDPGRLFRVTSDDAPVAEYRYDANGNRTEHRYLGGTSTATYDDQDHLLTYDDTTYTYTDAGELRTKTVAGATTEYEYDAFGNLRKVTLPGGKVIEYVIDGQNRRVGKKIDGVLIQGWLYSGQLRIVAELDGKGGVVSRFIYASRANVPDYMVRNGVTYRIVADHLGSPRAVVDAATGEVAQTLTYDEFGNLMSHTNPGLQPFGFAGGLYDRHTGQLRFGARDYDPQAGRWTTKDPILFDGGDTNLYGYSFLDPINWIDPSGLATVINNTGKPVVVSGNVGSGHGTGGQEFGVVPADGREYGGSNPVPSFPTSSEARAYAEYLERHGTGSGCPIQPNRSRRISDIDYYSNNRVAEKVIGDDKGPRVTLGRTPDGRIIITNQEGTPGAYWRRFVEKVTP